MCGEHSHWFSEAWSPTALEWADTMSWMERVIPIACALWGATWSGRRVEFHCDNSGVVGACAKVRSRDPRIISLLTLRQTSFLAASRAFMFRVQHAAGHDNDTADALSRLQIDQFGTLQPTDRPTPTPMPDSQFLERPTEQCDCVQI